MPSSEKVPFDVPEYERQVLYRDDRCIAFLAKWPTLLGYTLVAPLPPGVPYSEQQYAALMHEHGYLDVPEADQAALARRIRDRLNEPAH